MPEESKDKSRYPQIPTTVWWGVRGILNRTPNAVLNEQFLAIQLNVQEAAAKQYIAELISVGILNDEKKATSLALEWRMDSSYQEAVEKILKNVYPQALLDLAPHDEGDRQKATSFFMKQGLGQGAASNKAATYFLIGAKTPNEAPVRNGARAKSASGTSDARGQQRTSTLKHATVKAKEQGSRGSNPLTPDSIPLNVNVQIHISADAGAEQIEAIFSAMKRYLHDTPTR